MKRAGGKKTSKAAGRHEDKIRNHANRAGDIPDSDSDDNGVKKSDDDSVDDDASDIGWDSDNEHGVSAYKKKKSSRYPDADDSDYDSEEEDEAGGMLLSDMLKPATSVVTRTAATKAELAAAASSKSSAKRSRTAVDSSEVGDNSSSDSDGSDSDGSDSDGSEEALEEAHDRLINAIDAFSKQTEAMKEGRQRTSAATESLPESVHSSVLDTGDVSMQALLGALEDTRGLSAVRKSLSDLEKGLAAPTFVEKVRADRAERTYLYSGVKEDMNKWQETVVHYRHVSTLDLAQDKRQLANYKTLVNKFKPTTSMEKDIEMVLVRQGATDQQAEQREVDVLASRNVDITEIRERQAELAKVKALMFYEQMKRHRMNKIKSKAYRTIRKRQKKRREKFAGAGGGGGSGSEDEPLGSDEEKDLKEKEMYNRVKERMDMRHKNTSKWAKMALQHGKTNENLKAAYHESVRLGNELTKKISEDVGATGDGPLDDDSEEEEQKRDYSSAAKGQVSRAAARDMHKVLLGEEEEEGGDGVGAGAVVDGKYKKLFEMDFMKKAAEQQKLAAKRDAQSVLRELQEMEQGGGSDSSGDEDRGSDDEVMGSRAQRKKDVVPSKEDADEVTALLKMYNDSGNRSSSMAISRKSARLGATSSSFSISLDGAGSGAVPRTDSGNEADPAADSGHSSADDAEESNPWLLPSAASTAGKQQQRSGVRSARSAVVTAAAIGSTVANMSESVMQKQQQRQHNPANAPSRKERRAAANAANAAAKAATATATSAEPDVSQGGKKEGSESQKKPKVLVEKSQSELVQQAFAGPDLEAEFMSLKRKAVDDELGVDEKRTKIIKDVKAGWGDWAKPGEGGMVSQMILNTRDRLMAQVNADHSKKVQGRKDTSGKMMNVMISERRVKAASKYKIADIPHPFTTREEYERSLQMPVGEDWNASNVVKNNTKPEVFIRAGRIIEPIAKPRVNPTTQAVQQSMSGSAGKNGQGRGGLSKKKAPLNKPHRKPLA